MAKAHVAKLKLLYYSYTNIYKFIDRYVYIRKFFVFPNSRQLFLPYKVSSLQLENINVKLYALSVILLLCTSL